MNIGILQSAGIAGNIIERLLAEPELKEVFTPVVYSKENKNEKNVAQDLKFGNIEAVVVAPGSASEMKFEGSLPLSVGNGIRLATVMTQQQETEAQQLTAEALTTVIKKVWQSCQRDFLLSVPRIAVVIPADTMAETVKTTVDTMAAEGIGVFGPYMQEAFVAESMHQHFDAVIAITPSQAEALAEELLPDVRTCLIASLPMVITRVEMPADLNIEENIDVAEHALLRAIYCAIDIRRNRVEYDAARVSPLEKLYHERRDESDKVRFNVAKKAAPTNQ